MSDVDCNVCGKPISVELGDQQTCEDCRLVKCKFCGWLADPEQAHLHDGGWACEDCWDERLRVTE